jgi:hypothetical protein
MNPITKRTSSGHLALLLAAIGIVAVLGCIAFAPGLPSFRQSRNTSEQTTRLMLQHLDEGAAKIGGVKDSNGNWSFPGRTTNAPQNQKVTK